MMIEGCSGSQRKTDFLAASFFTIKTHLRSYNYNKDFYQGVSRQTQFAS